MGNIPASPQGRQGGSGGVTTHRPGRLPTLVQDKTLPQLLNEIVEIHVPLHARTEVVSLTVFDGPLTVAG
jgi:hypothetical protein